MAEKSPEILQCSNLNSPSNDTHSETVTGRFIFSDNPYNNHKKDRSAQKKHKVPLLPPEPRPPTPHQTTGDMKTESWYILYLPTQNNLLQRHMPGVHNRKQTTAVEETKKIPLLPPQLHKTINKLLTDDDSSLTVSDLEKSKPSTIVLGHEDTNSLFHKNELLVVPSVHSCKPPRKSPLIPSRKGELPIPREQPTNEKMLDDDEVRSTKKTPLIPLKKGQLPIPREQQTNDDDEGLPTELWVEDKLRTSTTCSDCSIYDTHHELVGSFRPISTCSSGYGGSESGSLQRQYLTAYDVTKNDR